MTLKLEGKKTVLYIKDKPFRQCMRLLVNIPREEIQDLDKIESIDDLSELYKNTDYYKPTDITAEDEFKGHHSNLQVWIEHDYDTRLLHSNLAFPLLKELAEQGVTKAKTWFKEEVSKRILSGNSNIIIYFIEQNYLSDFTEEELDILFEEYDFSQILKWKLEVRYSWLGRLLNIKVAKSFFRGHLTRLIKEEDWNTFSFILDSNHKYKLGEFSKDDSETIFWDFNYTSFLNYDFTSKTQPIGAAKRTKEVRLRFELRALHSMASLKISSAKKFLKNWINNNISSEKIEFLSIIFGYNYLQIFSEGEIKSLLKGLKLSKILDGGFRGLKILKEISRYDKTLVKPYMKAGIEGWFSAGNDYLIKETLDKRFLEIFTEKEQELIVKKINTENLRKAGPYKSLSILRRVKNLIPTLYKAEFELNFLKGDENMIDSFFRSKHFNDFTKEELTELFDKFNFKKIELSLFKKFLELGVPGVANKFDEVRRKSSKLVNLKKEIIGKFESGDYESLYDMFYKRKYRNGYKDTRLNNLISLDFEEIFKVVEKSENFKQNFEKALQKNDPPFSVPFKVLFSNIENTKSSVKEMFKEQASKIFAFGSQLNIIAFLSRPEYAQIFIEEEFQKIFTFKNKQLKSTIIKALEEDSAAPLPLVVLKRLTDNSDKEAEVYLLKQLLQLITTGTPSVVNFLNRDDFISYIKNLNIEMQLYLALSPDLNYSALKHLKSPKIEELVDENNRVEFNRIINNLQKKESGYLSNDDVNLLNETLPRFGIEALRGLIAFYSRDSLTIQLVAVGCILEIYQHLKSKVKPDIKRKLNIFFNRNFKPFIKYKYSNEKAGVKEYKEILVKFKTEYEELKNNR